MTQTREQPSTLALNPSQRTDSFHICILGGGFGGLYTALYLSNLHWTGTPPRITLVEQRDRFLFTPLLYELLTDELKTWEIAPTYERLLAKTGVQFRRDRVQGVDLHHQRVMLESGAVLTYDRLVLTLGRETQFGKVPGAATHAIPFRTLADFHRLQERLQLLETSHRPVQIAVVGGGASGVELATKLADRLRGQGEVRLIDRGNTLLKGFSRFSQKTASQALERRGVRVDLNTSIAGVDAHQITLVNGTDRWEVPTDLVVWAIGTRPQSWLQSLDLEQTATGQLVTLPTLQLKDHPEVFALGDIAAIEDGAGITVPTTAQAAFQQAKTAAHNLQASLQRRSLRNFHYNHLGEMMTLGYREAIVVGFGLKLKGRFAGVVRTCAYVFRLPTVRHRLRVVGHWLNQGMNRLLKRHPHVTHPSSPGNRQHR